MRGWPNSRNPMRAFGKTSAQSARKVSPKSGQDQSELADLADMVAQTRLAVGQVISQPDDSQVARFDRF